MHNILILLLHFTIIRVFYVSSKFRDITLIAYNRLQWEHHGKSVNAMKLGLVCLLNVCQDTWRVCIDVSKHTFSDCNLIAATLKVPI